MGLLDGGLQKVVAGVFGSLLLKGKIQRQHVGETRLPGGKVVPAAPPAPLDCRAFFEAITDLMRANGYGGRDVQITCLQLTPQGEQIPEPVEGDKIQLPEPDGPWYRIAMPITADAAKGTWTFRGTPA